MQSSVLRVLEFDRIVDVLSGLALTPTGEAQLAALEPSVEHGRVLAALRATTEGVRFLADHPGFPLRAPSDLETILTSLDVEGRALEPVHLLGLAEYLESIELSRTAVRKAADAFPILNRLVESVASFKSEIADVRHKIDPAGDVADDASPKLRDLRDKLRKQRTKLRTTLDSFLRGKETAKYLQDQVVTDRNGRYVLVVRAEHKGSIPGIVHGASASGASLYLEPLATMEINNDIVAAEEEEAEEVRRILLELTDAFRARPDELEQTVDVATELDVIQAKARLAAMVDGVEPGLSPDGAFELRAARHPLLIMQAGGTGEAGRAEVVPVNILLTPPMRTLVIAGPNTGGKTVALKTAGLLALMAQAGLHVPADHGSKIPVFKSVFADIGDEQSIAASLSTFSARITNLVSMERDLALPALVLLDEVGSGTDPVEGGALGVAIIDHFRTRGAHLVATTHYDSLKSYAQTTEGVASAAFGFNAENFAPTYALIYGSPGRSLAIEIAKRLGMPPAVIAAARENLSDREQQLAEHLAKVDAEMRLLERERRAVSDERSALASTERRLKARESALAEREETHRKKVSEKVDERVREARKEIDAVIDALKEHTAALGQHATRKAQVLSTGEAGQVRAEARAAVDEILGKLRDTGGQPSEKRPTLVPTAGPLEPGARVTVGSLGLEGTVVEIRDGQADVDVRGKRLRAAARDLRVIAPAPGAGAGTAAQRPAVKVNVDLQPREGSLSEINVVGCTVDEALTRVEKFLDESTVTDQVELRIVHGFGTGQLRRAIAGYLKTHPLVASYKEAPQNQGGGGATIVELKD